MKPLIPQFVKDQIAAFNRETKRVNRGRYLRAWADEIACFFLYGSAPDDYYQYEFYKLSPSERNKFITWRRSHKLIQANGADAEAIVEKDKFNQRFDTYLNRDWIDLQTASSETFQAFLKKHGAAFMKPLGGACGKGIFILNADEFERDGCNIEKYRSYIAEEVLHQHEAISRLNPNAVNTLRVLTYRGEILLAVLKLGTGDSIVDNQHAKGLNGNVDLETGITNTVFYDLDYNPYYRHPDTGEMLIGVEIPHWQELKDKVTAAAKELREVPYLGWDVAITPDGIAIIEANEAPGHDLAQGAAKIGVYQRIKEIEKNHRRYQ